MNEEAELNDEDRPVGVDGLGGISAVTVVTEVIGVDERLWRGGEGGGEDVEE
jgi:hypothetical protein